jgi:hypothetical protein
VAVFGYFLYCDNNIIDAVHVDARERFGRQGHRHQCIGRVFYLRHRVSYSPRFAFGDIAQFPYLIWQSCGEIGVDGHEGSGYIALPHHATSRDSRVDVERWGFLFQ